MAKKENELSLPSAPTVDLSGLDKMIASFSAYLAKSTATAQKQVDINGRQLKKEGQRNKALNKSLLAEIRANRRPSDAVPLPPSLSSAEVQSAARQTRIDAGSRMGLRRSILAGETGSLSPVGTGRSLLG